MMNNPKASETLGRILDYLRLPESVTQARMPISKDLRRSELPPLLKFLGLKEGVEIGIEEGVFSEELCQAIPGLKLHCVDPWKAYRGYRIHVSQEKLDGFYATTQARLAKYNCRILRKFSMEAVGGFRDNSLDFVYLDGNHDYQNVVNDLAEWSKKVRPGGIIAGHDYYKPKNQCYNHVTYAVDGFVRSYRIPVWFVLIDTRSGFSNSFLWVKDQGQP